MLKQIDFSRDNSDVYKLTDGLSYRVKLFLAGLVILVFMLAIMSSGI